MTRRLGLFVGSVYAAILSFACVFGCAYRTDSAATPSVATQIAVAETAGDQPYVEVDFHALRNFETSQTTPSVADVPDFARKLDGRRVRLCGVLHAEGDPPELPFTVVLMYDDGSSKWPPIQALVLCDQPTRWLKEFEIGDRVCADGVFHVGLARWGTGDLLFRLDVDRMEKPSTLRSLPFYDSMKSWLSGNH